VAQSQEPSAPQPITAEALQAAIDKLGDLDYPTRSKASQTVRRTPNSQAVEALLRTIRDHADGYVRYRALVLLTGFNDPRIKDAMRESLTSPNDRLRTVAYSYFEHNPDTSMTDTFLAALNKELAEFVRPALVRTLAALGQDARVRPVLIRESGRGEDFFRGAVIEALGDYKAQYAFDAISTVAKLEGPLQDDAAIALGKIGDRRSVQVLAGLQRTVPGGTQPAVTAALCLLNINCDTHEKYLVDTLTFANTTPNFAELARASSASLAALGVAGRASAVQALISVGIPARDPARESIALAVATGALRNTSLMLSILEPHPARADAIALMAEGFDMLEEDLDKELFFARVRRTYWNSPEGSATRLLMQTLIGKLEF